MLQLKISDIDRNRPLRIGKAYKGTAILYRLYLHPVQTSLFDFEIVPEEAIVRPDRPGNMAWAINVQQCKTTSCFSVDEFGFMFAEGI